jgi:CRISPR-associated endoribonuclease Cas6
VIGWSDEEAGRGLQPWVGRTSFEALVAAHTLQEPMPARVTLRFASPTVFKSKGAFMPLPLPRLVFEGLVRRWNAFSPVQVHPDVNRYAEEEMAISSYRLHTETVRFGAWERGNVGGGRALPGFVGSCTYVLRRKDRYWMGLVHLLAAFALYAGVGKQTTMGMGQVRRAWERGRGERGSVRV